MKKLTLLVGMFLFSIDSGAFDGPPVHEWTIQSGESKVIVQKQTRPFKIEKAEYSVISNTKSDVSVINKSGLLEVQLYATVKWSNSCGVPNEDEIQASYLEIDGDLDVHFSSIPTDEKNFKVCNAMYKPVLVTYDLGKFTIHTKADGLTVITINGELANQLP